MDLLQQINEKLKNKPLIYFCREPERALGNETLLKNYHICCIENNSIVDQLQKIGVSVFCLEKEGILLEHKTTGQLLSNSKTIEWINQIKTEEGFYAQTFLPANNIKYKIEKLGGVLLNNDFELNRQFESKLRQVQIFKDLNLACPKTLTQEAQNLNYKDLTKTIGQEFVIQTEKTHTGAGTYIINKKEEFEEVKKKLEGNTVKVTEFLKGDTFTFNIVITPSTYISGAFQYQITGDETLTPSKGSTIGNDFTFGAISYKQISEKDPNAIIILKKDLKNLTDYMRAQGYLGFAGIDLIYTNNEFKFIETNARQTANAAFESKLFQKFLTSPNLILLNLATFLNLDISEYRYSFEDTSSIKGAQIFLRAFKDNTEISFEPLTGIYRLQSDNSAIDRINEQIKENVIFIDEEQDKPLIFQKEAYSVTDINEDGIILFFSKKGSIKNKFDEICRIQTDTTVIYDRQIMPWIKEALKSISEMISI